MEKLLIVDGSNLLFQMFYGMPARIVNSRGKAIQGTLGFVGALLKILRMTKPTHLAVVFDGECSNERTSLDENYKANRPDFSQLPEEEVPFSQLPDIYAALDYLEIRHAETVDCEADDWISGYARLQGPDRDVIVVSQDSDFFQLISEHVRILRYRGKKTLLCDAAYIRQRYGIEPEQYAAFKSLTGDPSDNLRGADLIGPKTAAALLREYGTLESILANAEQIRKPSVRASVIHNTDRLRKNLRLIRLHGCQRLPFSLDELRFSPTEKTTGQILEAIGLK